MPVEVDHVYKTKRIYLKGGVEEYLALVDIFQKVLGREGNPINDDAESEGWYWDTEKGEFSVWHTTEGEIIIAFEPNE